MKELTLDQKKERGSELINSARKIPINPVAISYLENIVASMGTPPNIDNTNGLIADDIICICWAYRDNSYFMSVLEVQLIWQQDFVIKVELIDYFKRILSSRYNSPIISNGFCPQGRTHRLFQRILSSR